VVRETLYRFMCENCRTRIELIMPFRRKLCPLCGRPMVLWSVLSREKNQTKGGEENCQAQNAKRKKDGP